MSGALRLLCVSHFAGLVVFIEQARKMKIDNICKRERDMEREIV